MPEVKGKQMSDGPEQRTGGDAGQSAVPAPAGTRTSALWTSVIVFSVVLVLLVIFILQNQEEVRVNFFAAEGNLPLAVAMLLSAIGGALLVAAAGVARVVQLRRLARRQRKQDERRAS